MDIVKPFGEEKWLPSEDVAGSNGFNAFDALSNDLIISILCKISASAKSPSDLLGIMSSCKRMRKLGMDHVVLRNASSHAVSIRARFWCEGAHQFLTHCADARNLDATYMLGMIEFYCLGQYALGTDLLVQATQACHVEALHSIATIHFILTGAHIRLHCPHDPDHPVALWAKSLGIGHRVDITEIGYSIWSFSKFLLTYDWSASLSCEHNNSRLYLQNGRQPHPMNLFLTEWWQLPDVKCKIGPYDEILRSSIRENPSKSSRALRLARKSIKKLETMPGLNKIDD